jgi:hypothetical protein
VATPTELRRQMMVHELRRQRWILLFLVLASAALAWFFPLLWAMTIIALVLAVRNEWLIRQGTRRR